MGGEPLFSLFRRFQPLLKEGDLSLKFLLLLVRTVLAYRSEAEDEQKKEKRGEPSHLFRETKRIPPMAPRMMLKRRSTKEKANAGA
ncbi:MAG: hypothetical protein BWY86_00535 [Candidatus Aminicenantes bacterium ADurb.Bin508]|nr:MAG: hypothetical protein BWY86_00535 [Candidatus Aminicenantes bacterium ADurb.Bin508]